MQPIDWFNSAVLSTAGQALERVRADGRAGPETEAAAVRAVTGLEGAALGRLLDALAIAAVADRYVAAVRVFGPEEPEEFATYRNGLWYVLDRVPFGEAEAPPRRLGAKKPPTDPSFRIIRAGARRAPTPDSAPPVTAPITPAESKLALPPVRKAVKGKGRFVGSGRIVSGGPALSWTPSPRPDEEGAERSGGGKLPCPEARPRPDRRRHGERPRERPHGPGPKGGRFPGNKPGGARPTKGGRPKLGKPRPKR